MHLFPSFLLQLLAFRDLNMSTILFTMRDFSTRRSSQYSNQPFNLTDIYGNPVTVALEDIRSLIYYSAVENALYGIAVGLCSTLLIVMMALVLADRTKLHRPIFQLNMLSLFFVSCRGILQGIALAGPFSGLAQYFLGLPISNGNIFLGLLIAKALIQPLLYASILATLILQV